MICRFCAGTGVHECPGGEVPGGWYAPGLIDAAICPLPVYQPLRDKNGKWWMHDGERLVSGDNELFVWNSLFTAREIAGV